MVRMHSSLPGGGCGRPSPGGGRLPLAEHGVVEQVGRPVHAAEGVVDRLVSHRQRRVVGHDGVGEDVLGVFAGHVLSEGNKKLNRTFARCSRLVDRNYTAVVLVCLTSDRVPQYEWFLGVRSGMLKR